MIWIYGLVDPNTNRVRYVGQSANPRQRLIQHEISGSAAMLYWLGELKVCAQKASIVILDLAESAGDADRKEREWIAKFTAQGLLLNLQFNSSAKKLKSEVGRDGRGRLPLGTMNRGAAMLRMAMDATDMNQSDLAASLGITQPSVSGMLTGLSRPSLPNGAALQKLFGIPLDAWREPADAESDADGKPASASGAT